MTLSGRWRRRSIAAWVIVSCAGFFDRPASAQQFNVIQPKINVQQANVLSSKVATILRDTQGPAAAAQKDLDAYFKQYLYPSMTSTDPVDLGKLGLKREKLFTQFINTAKSQGARDYLNDITLKPMVVVAKGNYHPAVRYNAVLIIGQLDQQAGAKPLPAATDALLTFLENDKFDNAPVPTAVKLAALVGLQRALRLGVDAPTGDRIAKAAQAVVDREKVPDDVTPKVYGWIRRQAAQVLAAKSAKGLTPPIQDSFVRLLGDANVTLDDRCETARLLQPAMFKDAKDLNADAMLLALGDLARKVLDAEAKDADSFREKIRANPGAIGTTGGAFNGPEMGRGIGEMMAGVDDNTPHYEKRRMLDRTLAIVSAAEAVVAGSSDELKARATKLATTIKTVAEAAATQENEIEISQNVVALADEIDQLVAAWAPAAGDAPAEDKAAAPKAPAEPEAKKPAPAAAAGA